MTGGEVPGNGAAIRRAAAGFTDPEQQVLARIGEMRKRQPSFKDTAITMAHGAGGKASRNLVEGLIAPAFSNPYLDLLGDQAVLPLPGLAGALALTTDSFVVSPLFFPGGDIGELAVNGTVNDLAVGGAEPLYLSAAFILEEGLDAAVLRRVVDSMQRAALRAGIAIVTGDTKVVPRGRGDQIFITTTGAGIIREPGRLGIQQIRPGDAVLINGALGNHGSTVMLARDDLGLEAKDLRSDTMPLHNLVRILLESVEVHFMRDATRGGLATVLNEVAQRASMAIAIDEDRIPVDDSVRGVAELLGLDPLYIANEGKLVAFVAEWDRDRAVALMRKMPEGEQAACVGEVREDPEGMVFLRTGFGGTRVVDMLIGDPLPRIC